MKSENNGRRVRALREWAHRDESAGERQDRLERLVRAEVSLEKDLNTLAAAREAAEEWQAYCAQFAPQDDMGHPLANLMPLRKLLTILRKADHG